MIGALTSAFVPRTCVCPLASISNQRVGIRDYDERVRRLTSLMRAMSRFFWFTVEFGLMRGRGPGGIAAYGSGLLSSFGELRHSIESDEVQRYPLQLEWVINQVAEIDHYQPILFVIDSFDHLFSLVDEFERWMRAGVTGWYCPGNGGTTRVTGTDCDPPLLVKLTLPW